MVLIAGVLSSILIAAPIGVITPLLAIPLAGMLTILISYWRSTIFKVVFIILSLGVVIACWYYSFIQGISL